MRFKLSHASFPSFCCSRLTCRLAAAPVTVTPDQRVAVETQERCGSAFNVGVFKDNTTHQSVTLRSKSNQKLH